MKQKRSLDQVGLRLSRHALRVLKDRGIFAHSPVSLEHQHLAKRYVVRGLESGGAVGDIGRYVTFTQEDGQPIECKRLGNRILDWRGISDAALPRPQGSVRRRAESQHQPSRAARRGDNRGLGS